MVLENIDFKKSKILKIATVVIYIVAILIFEIGICNGTNFKKNLMSGEIAYNFSLSRISIYIIFIILLLKNIEKFIPEALETMKSPLKKSIIGIYCFIMICIDFYIFIKWTSIYKELTLIITQLMGILFIIYVSTDYVKNVVVIICTIATVFTFSTDFHHAIDEKKHMMSVVNIAAGNFQYANNPLCEPAYNNIIFNCDIDSFIQFFDKKYEPDLTDEWNITEETEIYYNCSSPAEYNFILYLPATIGVVFAKVLGGSIADLYIAGRLFNLIAYGGMVILMLKLLPYKKKIFFIIYMIPFQLLLAASYSVDGICAGILGIFIAYCLKLSTMDYKCIKIKEIMLLMILYISCLIVKNFSYCAIILFVLVLPIIKILKNNKKNLPFICTIITIAIMICAVVLINKVTAIDPNSGDSRGGETSIIGQIKFLCSSPTNILKVGFEHIMNSLLNYNWYTYLNHGSFFGKYSSQIFFIELIFIIYVVCTDEYTDINMRTKIVSIITFISIFVTTSIMLYLTFTPVGQINISGYQPRYLIALFPMILMIVNEKNVFLNKKQENKKITENKIALFQGMLIIADLICLTAVV